MSTILRRTTLKVRDMDQSIAFYEQVIGMKKYYDNELTLEGDLLPGCEKGDVIRLVIMQGEDDYMGMIGLMEWLSPKHPAPEVAFTFDYGMPVFVTAVEDAEIAFSNAKKNGCVIRAPLTEAEYPAPNGQGTVKVRSVGVFDPDGHFFELNQRLAG
ncbi:VOC family protein [Temperatibacter marinus]|uniref:VOC family protein n=1 Tax=Temperatibacter marinus TaxID=1456591 RepID=A0AA52HB77_9PROT|nr:VOC family protein [Temperatibacter marinus]WND03485.1 VOC family protein [Temperatibacter marinus]